MSTKNIHVPTSVVVSEFGQREMRAVYQVELTPSLDQVVSKRLDVVEYHTFDEDGSEVCLVLDVAEARDLLANLTTVLEVTR